jgi:hypothetical protein
LQPWQSELQRQGVLRQLVAINDHDMVSVSFSGFLQIISMNVVCFRGAPFFSAMTRSFAPLPFGGKGSNDACVLRSSKP